MARFEGQRPRAHPAAVNGSGDGLNRIPTQRRVFRPFALLRALGLTTALSALAASCTASSDTQPNAVFVTTTVTTKAPNPGVGLTPVPAGTTTLNGICPDPLVVQLDGTLDMWTLPWTSMLAIDGTAIDGSYTAVMVNPIDRNPTGIKLELREVQPPDKSVAQVLRDDRTVHLGTVSTDTAITERETAPLTYLIAPWAHDDRIVWWNASATGDALSLAEKTLDPNVTVTGSMADPAIAYLVGSSLVSRTQLTDQPGVIQFDQFLADPTGWLSGGSGRRWQFLTETGWSPYPHAVATSPSLITPLKACFEALVPIMQQAVVEVAREPERMVANLVEIATRSGRALSPELVRSNLRAAIDNGLLNSLDGQTVAEVTAARIEQALRADATSRRARGLKAPSVNKVRQEAKVVIADFTTNDLSIPGSEAT